MGTFAYYLVAAMIELNPPSEWEDIVEKALIEMNCSEGRKTYCTDELRKALEVAISFGTIKKLDDKYYLYEYGVVGAEGDITYQLEQIHFNDQEDIETDAMIDYQLSTLTLELLKETQLNYRTICERELQVEQSNLVGPITRNFLQNYIIRLDDDDEVANMDEPNENDNELEGFGMCKSEDLQEYEINATSISDDEIQNEIESVSSESERDMHVVVSNKRKYTSAPEIMIMQKKPKYDN